MNKQQIIALSKSAKKHIRNEKARIRHEFSDAQEREKQILKVYHKFIHEKAVEPESHKAISQKAVSRKVVKLESPKPKAVKPESKKVVSRKAINA